MKAIILLAEPTVMGMMFGRADKASLACEALRAGAYKASGIIDVDMKLPKDVAEDLFDLTNNPDREAEREEKYGHGRSLSIGDIVAAGGEFWLCVSLGWEKL